MAKDHVLTDIGEVGWGRSAHGLLGGGLAVSHKIESRRAKKEKSASATVRGDDDEGGRISK